MNKQVQPLDNSAAGKALLKRELEQGLASGVSTRPPDQIGAACRKAREGALKILHDTAPPRAFSDGV